MILVALGMKMSEQVIQIPHFKFKIIFVFH